MPSDPPQTPPPPPTQRTARRRLFSGLRVVIGLGLIALLCWWVNVHEVVRILAATDVPLFLAACGVALADRTLMAYKWRLLLRCRGVHITLWQATRLYFIGHVVGTLTPGAIGADAYRVVMLAKRERTSVLVSTVLIERMIGVAVVGVVGALMLPLSARYLGGGSTSVVLAIVAVATIGAAAVLLSLHPPTIEAVGRRIPFLARTRLAQRLREFYHVYAEYRVYPRTLLAFTVLTVAELYTLIVLNFLCTRAVGVDVSFTYYLAVMPLLHVLVRLPISFQAIGVQEGLFAYFLLAVGFSAAQGLSVSLIHRALEVVSVLLPSVLLLWLAPVRIAAAAPPTQTPSTEIQAPSRS